MRRDSAALSRDLPIPGSPETRTTRPSPAFACCHRRNSRSSSSSRPTSGGRFGAKGLEATKHAALADDPPGALRFGKPREHPQPNIFDLEQGADLPSRAIGDDERVWLRECLQPGGKVGRLANDPALLRRPRADQIADHDEPTGDAEPNIQRLVRREPAYRVDDGEPGPYRPFGIVLMRLGIAEIDHHPVPHILGDKTGEPGDRISDRAVIDADEFA